MASLYTSRITSARKTLDNVRLPAYLKLDADKALNARANQILLSGAVERIRKEIKTIEEYSNRLDKLLDDWSAYVQAADDEDELKKYDEYLQKQNFTTRLDVAQTKLAEFRDLEYTMEPQAQTQLHAAERDEFGALHTYFIWFGFYKFIIIIISIIIKIQSVKDGIDKLCDFKETLEKVKKFVRKVRKSK
jgi:hypothetical protein